MRVHPGRAALAAVGLAEVGAVVGALVAWLFVVGWALLPDWLSPPGVAVSPGALRNALLGAAVWAGLVGAPAGALALPLLGLTVLRRVPLGRAVGLPALGALLGLALSVRLSPGPSAGLAVPASVPALATLGLLAGAAAARAGRGRALPGGARRLPR